MNPIILHIRMQGKTILSATSESEGGVLAFRSNDLPTVTHGAESRLMEFLDQEDHLLLEGLSDGNILPVEVSLIYQRGLAIFRHDTGIPAITDAVSWWMPLEDCTIGDILNDTGLTAYAEPLDVANPFDEDSAVHA